MKITEELIEDSLYPDIPTEMKSLTSELGASADETLAILAWDMLNNGTVTTNHAVADGLALFSGSHTYIDGSTWSNLLSPTADLSATALQTAIDNFETTKDEQGRYVMKKASKIIVNPSNAWKAKELLNSAYDPESANNAVNTIKERNLRLIVSPYYTDKFLVRYISNGIEKIALNCGKLLRALDTFSMVKMLKIGQSAANLFNQTVQRLHGQHQLNWMMI